MSDYYIKYFDLIADQNVKDLISGIEYSQSDGSKPVADLIVTKENIETVCKEKPVVLDDTRLKILRFLYFVWLDGIQHGPPEWWCEMIHNVKNLVIVGTCLESLAQDNMLNSTNPMQISQVLIKLWDYIKTQEQNDNWNYIIDEYDNLCRKHSDLRELYFL